MVDDESVIKGVEKKNAHDIPLPGSYDRERRKELGDGALPGNIVTARPRKPRDK